MFSAIEKKSQNKIRNLFDKADTTTLYYHNLRHTIEVVNLIDLMSLDLSDIDASLLRIAGWFHDVGYLYTYHNHEDKGMQIAFDYLRKTELENRYIQIIISCIEATKLSIEPRNKLEEIIKDADIGFGVTNGFFKKGPLLRKEWVAKLEKKHSDLEWEKLQLNFLSEVVFYTDFAKRKLKPILEKNMVLQAKILKKVQEK
ncbi:MAG: HD domain-containing protein [Saprospiraceae bacterium]|nr:HD domain-containing protein [Saprospiraceae bacterium]